MKSGCSPTLRRPTSPRGNTGSGSRSGSVSLMLTGTGTATSSSSCTQQATCALLTSPWCRATPSSTAARAHTDLAQPKFVRGPPFSLSGIALLTLRLAAIDHRTYDMLFRAISRTCWHLATAEAGKRAAASAFTSVRRLGARNERALLLALRWRSSRNAIAHRFELLHGSKLGF